jgi:hypothetical protein
MNILSRTDEVREKAKNYGRYRYVADQSGVGYEWLVKFATGKIPNPRVDNVSALEDFFKNHEKVQEISGDAA